MGPLTYAIVGACPTCGGHLTATAEYHGVTRARGRFCMEYTRLQVLMGCYGEPATDYDTPAAADAAHPSALWAWSYDGETEIDDVWNTQYTATITATDGGRRAVFVCGNCHGYAAAVDVPDDPSRIRFVPVAVTVGAHVARIPPDRESWVGAPWARELDGPWPSRAVKTREHPDDTVTVIDGDRLASELAAGLSPSAAYWSAVSARVFLRYTDATCYAVTLWDGRAFFGSAGGYGYDRAAAALDGHPLGYAWTLDGRYALVCATDHGGGSLGNRPRFGVGGETGADRVDKPAYAILAHRGGSLPRPLFVGA